MLVDPSLVFDLVLVYPFLVTADLSLIYADLSLVVVDPSLAFTDPFLVFGHPFLVIVADDHSLALPNTSLDLGFV